MPPIGLLLGKVDFASLFYVLDQSKGVPASLADAKIKGIPVIAYGQFFNDLIGFLIIALVIFFLVKGINRIRRHEDEAAPAPTSEEKILIEIRDLLSTSRGRVGTV